VLLNVTALTQCNRIDDFGYSAIGKPDFMVCVPMLTERFSTSPTPSIGGNVEMPFLPPIEKTLHRLNGHALKR
jgi:hypothetical protein